MDGSGGGRKPAAPSRPAAKPPAASPPSSSSGSSSPPKPAGSSSKPVQSGMRNLKPTADEDDPFGVSSENQYAGVIQALPKPEKGKLHRVVCPMCEKPGFVSKSAIGKQVRCANEKCMVPVFTVPDPDAPKTDKPTRRSDSQNDTAVSSGPPRRKNPLIIYAIVGGVLLLLSIPLVQFLNKPPEGGADLNRPILGPGGLGGGETEVVEGSTEQSPQPAATESADPIETAKRLSERMIQSARQPKNRDKAIARRLTADLFLQLGDTKAAAQEFGQLLQVNRGGGFLRVDPLLRQYWKKKEAGLPEAGENFNQAVAELAAIPTEGKLAVQAAIHLAAALIAEDKAAEAEALIQRFQKDRQVVANRDQMHSSAWFSLQDRMIELKSSPLNAVDVYSWNDPLRTAVAAQLASHRKFAEAVLWSSVRKNLRETSDSLAVIAEIAGRISATAEEQKVILDAAAAAHPMISARTQAVFAAELKSSERLNAVAPAIDTINPATPMPLPGFDVALRTELPNAQDAWLAAAAAAEFGRAAAVCGDGPKTEVAVRKLTASLMSIAPPTADARRAADANDRDEQGVRKQLAAALRISNDGELTTTFRNYRRKIDQLSQAAEERRLLLIERLSRITRAGGSPALQTVLKEANNTLLPELAVDTLSNLIAIAALRAGQTIPEITGVDPAMRIPVPARATALSEITVSPVLSSGWGHLGQSNYLAALTSLEKGGELPGFREAVANEIVEYAAERVEKPEQLLPAIAALQNPVWREEAYLNATTILARRGLAKQTETWIDGVSGMPPTEHVSGLYGIACGVLQQPPAPAPSGK